MAEELREMRGLKMRPSRLKCYCAILVLSSILSSFLTECQNNKDCDFTRVLCVGETGGDGG